MRQVKRGKKPTNNEAARTAHYKKATTMADDYEKRLRFFDKRNKNYTSVRAFFYVGCNHVDVC